MDYSTLGGLCFENSINFLFFFSFSFISIIFFFVLFFVQTCITSVKTLAVAGKKCRHFRSSLSGQEVPANFPMKRV